MAHIVMAYVVDKDRCDCARGQDTTYTRACAHAHTNAHARVGACTHTRPCLRACMLSCVRAWLYRGLSVYRRGRLLAQDGRHAHSRRLRRGLKVRPHFRFFIFSCWMGGSGHVATAMAWKRYNCTSGQVRSAGHRQTSYAACMAERRCRWCRHCSRMALSVQMARAWRQDRIRVSGHISTYISIHMSVRMSARMSTRKSYTRAAVGRCCCRRSFESTAMSHHQSLARGLTAHTSNGHYCWPAD